MGAKRPRGARRSSARGDVRADLALPVAAGDVGAGGGPERLGGAEVAAEGVPGQVGMVGSQGGEPGAGESASLVLLDGVGLFDPSRQRRQIW